MHLARIRPSDASTIFLLWSDAEATRYTNWAHVRTLEECDAKLERVLAHYSKEPRHFGPYLVKSRGDEFLGIIGADLVSGTEDTVEIWYFIHRQFWGRGLGKASVQTLLAILLESGRVRRVVADVVPDNVASWKLLEGLGFKRHSLRKGGHRNTGSDVYEYEKHLLSAVAF